MENILLVENFLLTLNYQFETTIMKNEPTFKTHTLTGNTGERCEVISGLRLGDKVECIKDKNGLCDGGTYHVVFYDTLLTKGKVYTIDHLTNWDGQSAPYVTNDDGALTWATTEYFKPHYKEYSSLFLPLLLLLLFTP